MSNRTIHIFPALMLSLSLMLAGCASPTVIDAEAPGDDKLNCGELNLANQRAKDFEKLARDERGVTGTNVAAALFWLPGLAFTWFNTDEAIDAAKERQQHLKKLMEKKNC